jgi:hypothetical protein
MESKTTQLKVEAIDVPQSLFNELAKQADILMFDKCTFGELVISKRKKVEMRGCTWKAIVVESGTLIVSPDRLLGKIHSVKGEGTDVLVLYVNEPAEVLSESGVHYGCGPAYEISGYTKVQFLDHSTVNRDIKFVNQPEAQVYFDASSKFTGKLINGRLVTKRWE